MKWVMVTLLNSQEKLVCWLKSYDECLRADVSLANETSGFIQNLLCTVKNMCLVPNITKESTLGNA